MENNNIVDILKNISVQDLGEGRRMVKHTNGSYIICNSATKQIEQRGFVNPNPEYQLQKASEQRTNNIDNSFALEMYGLVNMITGRSDIYDNVAAYPSSHQRQYLKASEQQQRSGNNNKRSNAVELYELVQFIGGGNNINGW
jgi:hypothetical protein